MQKLTHIQQINSVMVVLPLPSLSSAVWHSIRTSKENPDMENTPDISQGQQHNNLNRFESDAHKIVRLHLQDKNHVITEDEIRNVRVGMTPPPEEIDSPELNENRGGEKASGNDTDPASSPLTPWDAVEP